MSRKYAIPCLPLSVLLASCGGEGGKAVQDTAEGDGEDAAVSGIVAEWDAAEFQGNPIPYTAQMDDSSMTVTSLELDIGADYTGDFRSELEFGGEVSTGEGYVLVEALGGAEYFIDVILDSVAGDVLGGDFTLDCTLSEAAGELDCLSSPDDQGNQTSMLFRK